MSMQLQPDLVDSKMQALEKVKFGHLQVNQVQLETLDRTRFSIREQALSQLPVETCIERLGRRSHLPGWGQFFPDRRIAQRVQLSTASSTYLHP